MTGLLIALCLFTSLIACSGGADDSRPPAVPAQKAVTAEGIYSGTSVANESIAGVVFGTGTSS
jgi:hypothetical protein